ncbi:hypothetical protein HDV01_005122 [Terramyces sp. JEL0728]|nr:hypothetical protein HDV01_005122 [Terramyces sp. JEL0728]
MLSTVFQSTWQVDACQGPPSTMLVFKETRPTKLYRFELKDFPFPLCGSEGGYNGYSCCFSSLDTTQTFGYKSFSRHLISSDYTVETSPPKSAIDSQYCMIEGDGMSIWGYDYMFLLNSNSCTESQFICNNTHLTVYGGTNCNGTKYIIEGNAEYYPLSMDPAYYNSLYLGGITVSQHTVNSGITDYRWIAYTPSWMLVPNSHTTMEIIALIAFALTIGGFLVTSSVYGQKLYSGRSKKLRDFAMFTTQTLWLIRSLLVVYYTYAVFHSSTDVALFKALLGTTEVCSLLSVLISFRITTEINKKSNSNLFLIVGSVSLLALHFSLVGPYYVSCFFALTDVMAYYAIANIAFNLQIAWMLFMFVFDLIPPLIIFKMVFFQQLTKAKKTKETTEEVLLSNGSIFSILLVHLFNCLLFIVISILRYATSALQNDRNALASEAVLSFCYMIHNVVICKMYESLREAALHLGRRKRASPKNYGKTTEKGPTN